MKFRVALLITLAASLAVCSWAQEGGEKPDTPKSAYIKVVNACDVKLPEPWRAGLDLSFKDNILAADIRPGERCSYRKITFTGKDHINLRMTQTKTEATRVPATFEKGCFYTLVITGQVSETGTKVDATIRKDFPGDPGKERGGFARVNVINTITSFPVSVTSDKGTPVSSDDGQKNFYFSGGEQPLTLKFKDVKGRDQTFKNSIIVEPDKNYSAIILNSTEGGNRPVVFKSCETDEMQDVMAQEKLAEEEKKQEQQQPSETTQ